MTKKRSWQENRAGVQACAFLRAIMFVFQYKFQSWPMSLAVFAGPCAKFGLLVQADGYLEVYCHISLETGRPRTSLGQNLGFGSRQWRFSSSHNLLYALISVRDVISLAQNLASLRMQGRITAKRLLPAWLITCLTSALLKVWHRHCCSFPIYYYSLSNSSCRNLRTTSQKNLGSAADVLWVGSQSYQGSREL